MATPGRYTVRENGTATQVEVLPDGRVRVADGALLTVTPLGGGAYAVSDGTTTTRVRVAGPAEDRCVACPGHAGRVEVEAEGRAPRRKRHAGSGETSAPMPATVIAIAVEPGQQVEAGDVLLKLEAMKMELPVRAPRAGTVGAIHCRVDELVQPGVPLVDLA